jgi:hypothetical protein
MHDFKELWRTEQEFLADCRCTPCTPVKQTGTITAGGCGQHGIPNTIEHPALWH